MSLAKFHVTRLAPAILALSILGTGTIAHAAADKTLEAFCLRTKADSPENCRCGQKTADEIASKDEQDTMIKMMTATEAQRVELMQSVGARKMKGIMKKLGQITSGC